MQHFEGIVVGIDPLAVWPVSGSEFCPPDLSPAQKIPLLYFDLFLM
jgi:hypothetical protein